MYKESAHSLNLCGVHPDYGSIFTYAGARQGPLRGHAEGARILHGLLAQCDPLTHERAALGTAELHRSLRSTDTLAHARPVAMSRSSRPQLTEPGSPP